MFTLKSLPGIFAPVAECDVCGKEITDSKKGNIEFYPIGIKNDYDFTKIATRITHKHCSYNNKVLWIGRQQLDTYLENLLYNINRNAIKIKG